MHLLIAIPALNEEQSISGVIEAIRAQVTDWEKYSIVVIDDGSIDTTAQLAIDAGAEVVNHKTPLGVAQVFRVAVRLALEREADTLVMIDGDGQFDPSDIPRLLTPIVADEADFVAADRFSGVEGRPPDMPAAKYIGNRMMNRLIRGLTGSEVSDVSSGFRAYSREALLHLNIHSSFTYTQEVFLDLATKRLRIQQVPVEVRYDPERRSRVVRSIMRYALRSTSTILRTVRDNRPFFVFGLPAVLLCVCGAGFGIVPLAHFIREGSFSPYIFMALTGAYLFTLGIILAVVALASDMLRPIRRNQEMMLYLSKRALYGSGSSSAGNSASRLSPRHAGDRG
jgi:glycosyltransferase involved in cell wall biosynthesis